MENQKEISILRETLEDSVLTPAERQDILGARSPNWRRKPSG